MATGSRPDPHAEMMRRRRRSVMAVLLIVAGLLITVDFVRGLSLPAQNSALVVPDRVPARPAFEMSPASKPTPAPSAAAPTPSPTGPVIAPKTGTGTFGYAASTGPVLGKAGTVRTFQVAAEHGSQQSVDAFAAAIDTILGDDRSWVGSGDLRLQRVPQGGEFTIYLATEGTSESMCREDGLETKQYTSCRLASGKVVINLARWLNAVPEYGAPLSVYREYAINHEVGHQLGKGHERCPAPGAVAPVMLQQTLGLYGCTANPWPYIDGKRYTGPPGSYGGES